jgi:hypothetical protein
MNPEVLRDKSALSIARKHPRNLDIVRDIDASGHTPPIWHYTLYANLNCLIL